MDAAKHTALYAQHLQLGAKMVDFAGYAMPLQYPQGIVQEHLHTRAQASLFDVSHMGQVLLRVSAQALERLFPVDAQQMTPGRQVYSFLLNEQGGVEDDLMISRRGEDFYLVLNAARKEDDLICLRDFFGADQVQCLDDQALLALQGPAAAELLAQHHPQLRDLAFMQAGEFVIDGVPCWVSRSGYTGEDGFEISLPNAAAPDFFAALLKDARVQPAGLGARDSLRLEAGLCLYGQELRSDVSPLEAGLLWAIAKSRRPGAAKAGGYRGSEALAAQLAAGAARKRVGLRPQGKMPVRAHTPLFDAQGRAVGEVTSGGFAPSLNAPVAMALVDSAAAAPGSCLQAQVRGKLLAVDVVALPFVSKRYQS